MTEAAIQSNQSIDSTLESLSGVLAKTISAIRAVIPAESAPAGAPDPSADPSTVVRPLSHLKKLLEGDDAEASDFLLGARSTLSQVLTTAEVNSLYAHVGNFAYADALRSVAEITTRLSLTLE